MWGLRTILPFVWDSQAQVDAARSLRISFGQHWFTGLAWIWTFCFWEQPRVSCNNSLKQNPLMFVSCHFTKMALNSSGIFHSGYVCARFLHDFLVLTTCSVQASKVVAGFRVGVQKIQIKAEILAPRPSHGLALQRWGGFEREKKWPCFLWKWTVNTNHFMGILFLAPKIGNMYVTNHIWYDYWVVLRSEHGGLTSQMIGIQ